jgi:hypothetical protein
MNIGDIITTYHKGYWRLIKINRRYYTEDDINRFGKESHQSYYGKKIGDEYSPIFVYEHVMTENFKLAKKKNIQSCDAEYCKKVTKDTIEKMKDEYISGLNELLELLK